MTTETAQNNEELVRAVYDDAHLAKIVGMDRFIIIGVPILTPGYDTEAQAWAAAWEYTEAAMEEVRQLKAEIEWAEREVAVAWTRDLHASSRVLARLQSLLAAKSAGMKTPANLQDTAEPVKHDG